MIGRIQSEITRFKEVLSKGQIGDCRVNQVCEYGYVLEPKDPKPLPNDKTIGLTVMAVTHGNEVGGIAVLNEFLWLINRGRISIDMRIGVILGNPWASMSEQRFVDRDLNRSFGRKNDETHEDKRARDLEKILGETLFLLDIHQTIEKSDTGFFIFPYKPENFAFARKVRLRIPIVTHWGGGFSKDGACTDEYVNSCGGTGITLELGQKGFDSYHVSLGVQGVLNAYEGACDSVVGAESVEDDYSPEIYTWGQIVNFSSDEMSLDEGWYNFKAVEEGQRLGVDGSKIIKAECNGKILFPKYLRGNSKQRPAELCRVMRRVDLAELESIPEE